MKERTKVIIGIIAMVTMVVTSMAIVIAMFWMPTPTTISNYQQPSAVSNPPINPNEIYGLSVQASDYQIFITYTPEPGAKIMRVEYFNDARSNFATVPEAFEFPLKGESISTTFQRGDSLIGGDKMRVTIIYDNNVIKYTEFKT